MKLKEHIKKGFSAFIKWLSKLSFRTGAIVLICCIPFYILSFAQMLLPISPKAKTTLWIILFGLAKTTQYLGLTILGAEGYKLLKSKILRKKAAEAIYEAENEIMGDEFEENTELEDEDND